MVGIRRMGLADSGVKLDPEEARGDVEPWVRMTGGGGGAFRAGKVVLLSGNPRAVGADLNGLPSSGMPRRQRGERRHRVGRGSPGERFSRLIKDAVVVFVVAEIDAACGLRDVVLIKM
jgi:hypothetical protein